jgi:hypothetical protein
VEFEKVESAVEVEKKNFSTQWVEEFDSNFLGELAVGKFLEL